MRVGIIDADLLYRPRQRFPNLACMKISGFYKREGHRTEEFMDSSRKKLCFLDDNFLACREWERLLDSVLETGKRFQFRQGLNLRIMQESQMKKLFSGKLDDTVLFAFDDIRDRDVIERKLDLLNRANQILCTLRI